MTEKGYGAGNTPEAGELRTALDAHIDAYGVSHAGFKAAKLIAPAYSGLPIERWVFYEAARSYGPGEQQYEWTTITPEVGSSQVTLLFGASEVIYQRADHILWSLEKSKRQPLPPEKLCEMYDEITDPTLEFREEAIRRFYEVQHEQRSLVGRAVANVLGLDRPSSWIHFK
jgi:hypothetical protein